MTVQLLESSWQIGSTTRMHRLLMAHSTLYLPAYPLTFYDWREITSISDTMGIFVTK